MGSWVSAGFKGVIWCWNFMLYQSPNGAPGTSCLLWWMLQDTLGGNRFLKHATTTKKKLLHSLIEVSKVKFGAKSFCCCQETARGNWRWSVISPIYFVSSRTPWREQAVGITLPACSIFQSVCNTTCFVIHHIMFWQIRDAQLFAKRLTS